MPDSREADVVVVGAGLAGLAAARKLTAEGIDCVVLEARDRVGGRTLNHSIGDGKIVEVGGQWVGPTQTRVLELMRELGLESFPTYDQGEHVIEYEGELKRYTGTIPKISKRHLADFGQAQWKLDRMARKVPPDAPWTAPKAKEWDSQTLWSWMRRNVYTQGARDALSLGVEAVWAVQPEDLSLLHVLFYISSAGGLDALWDTEGGAQDSRVVGGSQLISIRMAEELGDRVVLDAPVRRIAYEPDRVTVHADGIEVEARQRDRRAASHADLPDRLRPADAGAARPAHAADPAGRGDQVHGDLRPPVLARPGPHRPGDEHRGPGQADVRQLAARRKPRRPARLPRGQPGARTRAPASPEARRAAVIDCFTRLFGREAETPLDYVDKSWADEEWTRGCYGCYMPTGAWTAYGPQLRAPVGPDPLGRCRDRGGLERLYGRRCPLRRPRRRGGCGDAWRSASVSPPPDSAIP